MRHEEDHAGDTWAKPRYSIVRPYGRTGRQVALLGDDRRVLAFLEWRRDARCGALVWAEDRDVDILMMRPAAAPLSAWAVDVSDPANDEAIGQVRRREFRADRNQEWQMLDGHGITVGMMTAEPSRWGPLAGLGPFRLVFPRKLQVHWQQAIVGTIRCRGGLPGAEWTGIDLGLDRGTSPDHRLVLAAAACIQDEDHVRSMCQVP